MDNIHVKSCLITLIISEVQIKTTRYHLTSVRMAIIEKNTNNNCWYEVEARESSYTVDENGNWGSQGGKQYGGFSKN